MLKLDIYTLVARAIVLLTAIPVHEAAHAWVADKLGDPTARYRGRLTLNPMAHFDPVGSVCMLLTGIGWAKAVPINPINFDDRKKGMAISAAAGPAANILLALLSLVAAKIMMYIGYMTGFGLLITVLYTIFSAMCSINISLAIFNLLPFPPFDGSRIFNYFLSDKIYFKIMEYEQYIFIGLLVLLYIGVFDLPLAIISNVVYAVLDKFTFVVDAFFRLII